jgi:hypothetical protein
MINSIDENNVFTFTSEIFKSQFAESLTKIKLGKVKNRIAGR